MVQNILLIVRSLICISALILSTSYLCGVMPDKKWFIGYVLSGSLIYACGYCTNMMTAAFIASILICLFILRYIFNADERILLLFCTAYLNLFLLSEAGFKVILGKSHVHFSSGITIGAEILHIVWFLMTALVIYIIIAASKSLETLKGAGLLLMQAKSLTTALICNVAITAGCIVFYRSVEILQGLYLNQENSHLPNLLITLISINIIIYVSLSIIYVKKETAENLLLVTSVNLNIVEDHNKELRAYKHDMHNQLQIVAGLLQLNKHDTAQNYLYSICKELPAYNIKPHTGNMPLDALLSAKFVDASNKLIKMCIKAKPGVVDHLDLTPYEITRTLGNLIDNAIYEEINSQKENKYIEVSIDQENDMCILSVHNKNSFISEAIRENIFKAGFTTKGIKGQGFGLYVVKKIITNHKGVIEVISYKDHGTTFFIKLPKAKIPCNEKSFSNALVTHAK